MSDRLEDGVLLRRELRGQGLQIIVPREGLGLRGVLLHQVGWDFVDASRIRRIDLRAGDVLR